MYREKLAIAGVSRLYRGGHVDNPSVSAQFVLPLSLWLSELTPDAALTALKIAVSRWLLHVPALLFAAAYGITVYALWVGVDFGTHWDEVAHYNLVVQSYQYQLFLPHVYMYPSMTYWLDLASVSDKLFTIFSSMVDREIFWSTVYSSLSKVYTPISKSGELIDLMSPLTLDQIPFDFRFFILRARVLVMLVSSLGGVWVFLSLRASDLARPALAAALGGSVYILSWEFGYHARWLAPDLILTQFVALFVFFLAKAERAEKSRGWLTSAAVAAGLATATKYTAGGLVPALWLYVLLRGRCSRRALLATMARHTAVAVGVFVAITPGTLLEPLRFATDVLFVMHHYARSHGIFYGVSPYDIDSHWLYLVRLWEYFSFAMLSPQPVIAAVLAAVSILGLVPSWYRSKPLTAALGFLIVFYSIFFSRQGVFIVRNFLMLLPVFAYLAGVGLDALIDREFKMPVGGPRQAAILATSVALAIAFGWNAWQQVAFGRSIANAQREPLVRLVTEYLEQHPSVRTALSPCLAADLSATGAPLPANVTEPSRALRYIFRMSELTPSNAHLAFWPATRHDTFDWIGPREVNLNYYPTWSGADHAIILNIDAAEHMGVVEALSHGRHADMRNSCPPQPVPPR
jgi:Dolichyl-phosphate-mannose-protein mannosyltransferase